MIPIYVYLTPWLSRHPGIQSFSSNHWDCHRHNGDSIPFYLFNNMIHSIPFKWSTYWVSSLLPHLKKPHSTVAVTFIKRRTNLPQEACRNHTYALPVIQVHGLSYRCIACLITAAKYWFYNEHERAHWLDYTLASGFPSCDGIENMQFFLRLVLIRCRLKIRPSTTANRRGHDCTF